MPNVSLDLSRRAPGLSYGLQLPPELRQAQPMAKAPQQNVPLAPNARTHGIAEALGNTPRVEGGNVLEAIAAALTGGLRGRDAQDMRQMELDDRTTEQKQGAQDRESAQELQSAQIARLLSQAQEQPERWSDPYELGGVQVQRNERDNQVRSIGNPPSAMIYQPPPGYRGTPETGLEAIPGGPADLRATAEGRAHAQAMDSSIRQLDNAVNVLNDLSSIQNNATGFVGGLTRGIPGTAAYDLNQSLEPVRAILSFENLQEMRRNSTTGGALGSIAVRELELLGNTVRSLDTAQSPQQLASAIRETRSQLTRALRALQNARQEYGDGGGTAAPSEPYVNDGSQPEQPRVRTWNRNTGRVE